MEVGIRPLLSGARSAKGIAVIIDVINASSTIVQCFESGCKDAIAVKSMKEALQIKRRGDLICGEVGSLLIRPDFYNSPYSAAGAGVNGRRVIIKTDAGTKGILGARMADEVILGCFLNADAVGRYIRKRNPKIVTLVPMGDYGKRKNVEDECCAAYLRDMLLNKGTDSFAVLQTKIRTGSVRNIFRALFMRDHIGSSLRLNTSKIVPRLASGRRLVACKMG